jgi:hypothetical protein
MKSFVTAALCLIFAAVVAPAMQSSDALSSIVTSYLEIQERLAADKIDGIKGAASAIAAKAAAMGDKGQALANAAKAVGESSDLKAARDAFGPLSDAVIAAAQSGTTSDLRGVKLGFCPMVKRSWLQKEGKVRNPYYGSAMLECGDLKDLKK